MRRILLIAFVFSLIANRSIAFAENSAVFIPFSDQGAGMRQADQMVDLIAKWLGERDIDVILPEQAAESLPSDLRYCRKEDCALNSLKFLSVDYVILSSIQSDSKGKGPIVITLCLLTPAGQKYEQSWTVRESLWLAIDAALTRVYTNFLRELGPWLSVQGTPLGARVSVDKESVGQLPFRGRISSGWHHVQISQNGFSDYSTYVNIGKGLNLLKELEVSLIPVSASKTSGIDRSLNPATAMEKTAAGKKSAVSVPVARKQRRASSWNYLIGGVCVAGAIPLMIIPVANRDERNGDRRNLIFLTAGVTAIAIGAVFLVARPIFE
jgi:hypothetical protein